MTENKSTARGKANPFRRLVYVYIGTSHFEEDLDFYENKLGAALLWNLKDFGPGLRRSTSVASPTFLSRTT